MNKNQRKARMTYSFAMLERVLCWSKSITSEIAIIVTIANG